LKDTVAQRVFMCYELMHKNFKIATKKHKKHIWIFTL